MANITEPESIIEHFLRSIITDPNRSGLSTRVNDSTLLFSGDASATTFYLPSNLTCVKSVLVGGSRSTPFMEYNIDIRNAKINFVTPPPIGTDNISIEIQTGKNWIFADKPRSNLTRGSFPRIAVLKIAESSTPQGMSEDDTYDTLVFQIDVLAYKNMLCEFDDEVYEGAKVTAYLARKIKKDFLSYWRTNIKAKLFDPIFLNINPIPYDEGQGIFRHMIEIQMKAFNAGE